MVSKSFAIFSFTFTLSPGYKGLEGDKVFKENIRNMMSHRGKNRNSRLFSAYYLFHLLLINWIMISNMGQSTEYNQNNIIRYDSYRNKYYICCVYICRQNSIVKVSFLKENEKFIKSFVNFEKIYLGIIGQFNTWFSQQGCETVSPKYFKSLNDVIIISFDAVLH